MQLSTHSKQDQPSLVATGFTLIELIIGVVVLAFAFSLIATLIFPQAIRSAEPVLQVRAANLAQAFVEEIQGKAFDDNSAQSGGTLRCGEAACASLQYYIRARR